MQSALEAESKGKAEALRMKKKLEGDVAELSLALEHAIAGNLETGATVKKYAAQVRDAQAKVDEESAMKSQAADGKVAAERKAAAMQNALEEGRALLETADRQRRSAEQELADTNETLADLTNTNQSIAAAKRKLESELDAEGRRFADVSKNLRKSERGIKELIFAGDEDKKNHERMQALIDQLQGKLKSYKKQIEEAEEIAALNLAKYRKVAGALGDAEAVADANEQALAMKRARARSTSLGPC